MDDGLGGGSGGLEFRLLGPVEAILDERPLALGGRRQRALLAILLLRPNEVLSRDRLIDELWNGEAPAGSANALAAIVARLRRVLPRDVLVTQDGGYEIAVEPESIDSYRFERLVEEGRRRLASGDPPLAAERLRSALRLWRGPPLAELGYEPFAEGAVARLEELRLTALENRIDADLALGRHDDLVGELQSLVLAHPLNERLRAQLMVALYRSGRQADALEAYQQARRILVDQLGLEPSHELQRVERAILQHERWLALHDLAADPDAPARRERKVVSVLAADLVGFTGRAARLDPEEIEDVLLPYQRRLRRELELFGGTVEKFIGDAVTAVFGAPVAHEDDPERAVRAALSIRDAIRDEGKLEVRIAVNTGEALVRLDARADAGEAVAIGDVVNATSRLLRAAPVNGVVVGDSTYAATKHVIDYEPARGVEA